MRPVLLIVIGVALPNCLAGGLSLHASLQAAQHVEQRRSCPWFLTWPLLCLLQRCLNQLKSVSTQFRALCLFPEGVNVVPNAVLKSFSVSSKRLVIELKMAKR